MILENEFDNEKTENYFHFEGKQKSGRAKPSENYINESISNLGFLYRRDHENSKICID